MTPATPYGTSQTHAEDGSIRNITMQSLAATPHAGLGWDLKIEVEFSRMTVIHGCVNMQPIGNAAQETAGEYICAAQDVMTSSKHAVFVTHNDFQGTTANDTTGLIPVWTGMPPLSCIALLKQ